MDIFNQLGELALGSRLKRLSDQIMRHGARIYQANDIDFEPKWFPVFYSQSRQSPLRVTEMAQELGVSHAAISQVVRELLQKKLIKAVKDPHDGRKRLLSLSDKGLQLLPRLEEIWNDIAVAFHEMINAHQTNIIDGIREVEHSFLESPLDERVAEVTQRRCLNKVKIIPYASKLKHHFKTLNYAWISKYFKVEEPDEQMLSNPQKHIINEGGQILFAELEGQIVGTCALIKLDDNTFELAKMAVDEKFQGRHVGKKLGLAVIEAAREMGARRLVLESNKKLTPALNLYRKLGFVPVCTDHHTSIYQRANVSMQMDLADERS